MLSIQDRIKKKYGMVFGKHGHTFHLVFINRIADSFTQTCIRIQHKAVVDTYGFHSCNPRQNGFPSAAVTTEIMMYDRSSHNNVIDMTDMLIEPDRRTAGGITEILKILTDLGITVIHF